MLYCIEVYFDSRCVKDVVSVMQSVVVGFAFLIGFVWKILGIWKPSHDRKICNTTHKRLGTQ